MSYLLLCQVLIFLLTHENSVNIWPLIDLDCYTDWNFWDVIFQAVWLLTTGLKSYVWVLSSVYSEGNYSTFQFFSLLIEVNNTGASFVYFIRRGNQIPCMGYFPVELVISVFWVVKHIIFIYLWDSWIVFIKMRFFSLVITGL